MRSRTYHRESYPLTFWHPTERASSKRVEEFAVTLAETSMDANRFKMAVRDFLIQLKEFEGDNAELFLEERELEASARAAAEREAAIRVPGMLRPSQIDDEEL
jgi:exportin-1